MDFKYLEYMHDISDFFIKVQKAGEPFVLPKYDVDKWDTYMSFDYHWMIKLIKNEAMIDQGWKIHVSSNLNDAQDILNEVSKICYEKNLSFKYVKDRFELKLKNTKYADRSSSGKFITVYPCTEELFIETLESIHDATKNFEKGPYILTDKRWRDGNVYFRYGGFKAISKDDDKSKLYIYNDQGNLIEDDRSPYYKIPDFIKEPNYIVDIEKGYIIDDSQLNNLNKYDITEAIHFSNGGGLYKALELDSGKKVILKEGRHEAGLDRNDVDAFNRVHNEYKYLNILKDVEGVVNPIEVFDEWENAFLVEEFVDGVPLTDWLTNNYPFVANADENKQFVENIMEICNKLKSILYEIHSKGVGFGDLQPNNIILKKDNNVVLIDLEAAKTLDYKGIISMGTPGFLDTSIENIEESDYISLISIILHCFLPIGPVNAIEKSNIGKQISYIENHYGKMVSDYIINSIDEIILRCPALISYKENIFHKNSYEIGLKNLKNDVKKIVDTMINNVDLNSQRIFKGDIRQFEYELGMYNILTGAYGCIYALSKYIDIRPVFEKWIIANSDFSNYDDCGLFTGKSGIALVLYSLGYYKEAINVLKEVEQQVYNYIEGNDISIISGLSGIGYSFLRMYKKTRNKKYLKLSKNIINNLLEKFHEKKHKAILNEDFSPIGLITGWTGLSYLLLELYEIEKLPDTLIFAKMCLEEDLSKCKQDNENGLYVDFDNILSPYLLGGSIGIGICIQKFRDIGCFDYEKQLKEIEKIATSKSFYNIGLFRGANGILQLIANMQEKDKELYLSRFIDMLNIYLIERDEDIWVPGEFCYKLSEDVFSGRAGLLLTIHDILAEEHNSWLEII
ncbi:class III lanthionine synthetase LanKC [Peptoniphilus vaginalis]|uniref:class III lanthionine synthetase LanKC n=1 Tax=Peptoniphilus vaginalis TaxID=1756987 RepID=UPI001FD708F3|nr:class III lanthionine synthetase LanKC [Peptoniphilus vaginalis]